MFVSEIAMASQLAATLASSVSTVLNVTIVVRALEKVHATKSLALVLATATPRMATGAA